MKSGRPARITMFIVPSVRTPSRRPMTWRT
jgi:hypothetical protein